MASGGDRWTVNVPRGRRWLSLPALRRSNHRPEARMDGGFERKRTNPHEKYDHPVSSATFRGHGCSTRIRINASRHDSRQEPYAVVPHVRICAGGGERSSSLPRPTRLPSSQIITGTYQPGKMRLSRSRRSVRFRSACRPINCLTLSVAMR